MTIVAGFDVHRAQITFDALDRMTGEVEGGRIAATPDSASTGHVQVRVISWDDEQERSPRCLILAHRYHDRPGRRASDQLTRTQGPPPAS
jgi:hypothetical protein